MNWASENHEEALQLFKQTMSYYCEDEDITDPGKIALKILRGIGNEGLKRLNASGMSDADKKRPDKIWELFESQLKTNLNFSVHRLHLDYRQRSEESLDDFVTRARTQALKREFEESELEEKIIGLMIASTPIEVFQRELLGKAKGYKLTDALAEGRPGIVTWYSLGASGYGTTETVELMKVCQSCFPAPMLEIWSA